MALSTFDSLALLPGAAGDAERDWQADPPQPGEFPADTTARQDSVAREGQRIFQASQRMKAGDFARRNMPAFTDFATGEVKPVTDATGAPLNNFDKRNAIAYDSAGNPQKIGYDEHGPVLSDPFAGLPTTTDRKTGYQYKIASGLPWKPVGQDEEIKAQNLARDQDKAVAQASSAMGRQLTMDERNAHRQEVEFRHRDKEFAGNFGPIDYENPNDARASLESSFDERMKAPEANAKKGWFDRALSPDAEKVRAGIATDKAKALQHFDALVNAREQIANRRSAIDQTTAQRDQLEQGRIDSALGQARKAGVIPGLDDPSTSSAVAASGSAEERAQPEAQAMQEAGGKSASSDSTVIPGLSEAQKKSEPVDRAAIVAQNPGRVADSLTAAAQAGHIAPPSEQEVELAKVADQKYAELEKIAGSAPVLKALTKGVGMGAIALAAYQAGAPAGAAAGGPIGAWVAGIAGAETGPGEAAIIPAGYAAGSFIGSIVSGLSAAGLAALAAHKGIDKLGEYSDAVASLNAAGQLHPTAEAVGEFAGTALSPLSITKAGLKLGIPGAVETVSKLGRLGRIASSAATDLGENGALAGARAIGSTLAQSAAGGLIFEGAIRPAFDTAVYGAAHVLGLDAEKPAPPTLSSLTQMAALSMVLSGHSLEFKSRNAGQVASVMVRGKAREDLGIPLDSTDPADAAKVLKYMDGMGVPIDPQHAPAAQFTAPLGVEDAHLYQTLSAKIEAMKKAGKFDGKTGDFVSAEQVSVPGLIGKKTPITAGGVLAVDRAGGEPAEPPRPAPVEPVLGLENPPGEKPITGRVVEPTGPAAPNVEAAVVPEKAAEAVSKEPGAPQPEQPQVVAGPETPESVLPDHQKAKASPTATETPSASQGQPTMITRQMEADLKARGVSQEQVARMTPKEAVETLAKPHVPDAPLSGMDDQPAEFQGVRGNLASTEDGRIVLRPLTHGEPEIIVSNRGDVKASEIEGLTIHPVPDASGIEMPSQPQGAEGTHEVAGRRDDEGNFAGVVVKHPDETNGRLVRGDDAFKIALAEANRSGRLNSREVQRDILDEIDARHEQLAKPSVSIPGMDDPLLHTDQAFAGLGPVVQVLEAIHAAQRKPSSGGAAATPSAIDSAITKVEKRLTQLEKSPAKNRKELIATLETIWEELYEERQKATTIPGKTVGGNPASAPAASPPPAGVPADGGAEKGRRPNTEKVATTAKRPVVILGLEEPPLESEYPEGAKPLGSVSLADQESRIVEGRTEGAAKKASEGIWESLRGPVFEPKLRAAYDALVQKSRWKFPAVSIGELAKESGTPLADLKARLYALHKQGRVVLSIGDWSLSTPETRAGMIDVNGQRMTQVRPIDDVLTSKTPAVKGAPKPEPTKAHHDAIVETVNKLKVQFPGVDVNVLHNETEAPELEGRIKKRATHEGLTDATNGKVYLFSDHISTPERAVEVFAHEVVGHFGVEKLIGEQEFQQIAEMVLKEAPGAAKEIARLYAKGKALDDLTPEEKATVAREYVARMAEQPAINPSLWQRFLAFLRRALRKLGLRKEWSNAELRDLVRRAARVVEKAVKPEAKPEAGEQAPDLHASLTSDSEERVSKLPEGRKDTRKDEKAALAAQKQGVTKSRVADAIEATKAAAKAVGDYFTKLDPVDSYRKAKGEWLGAGKDQTTGANGRQVTAIEARNLQQRIFKQFPNKLTRQAVSRYIEADGDATVLAQQAKASKPALRAVYERAVSLNPQEVALAKEAQQFFDELGGHAQKLGLLNDMLENYVTHFVDRSSIPAKQQAATVAGVMSKASGGKLKTRFDQALQRVMASMFELEQKGYRLSSSDIGEVMAAYSQSFNNTVSDRTFVKSLTTLKAEDGRPLAVTSGYAKEAQEGQPDSPLLVKPHTKPEDAKDYVPINHPALRKWKWTAQTEDGKDVMVEGDILVHPQIAQDLKNTLGTSSLNKVPLVRGITALQSEAKHLMLGLSMFHYVQEGTHALGHRVNPFKLHPIDTENPITRELMNVGLLLGMWDAKRVFGEGLASSSTLLGKVPWLGKFNDQVTNFLFEHYIPGLKNKMAEDAFARNLKAYAKDLASGKITREQVAQRTARQANDAFGGQNNAYAGNNPTRLHAERLGFLAPDFLKSRLKFFASAFTKYGTEQRHALILLALTMMITAKVLERLITGQNDWEKPFAVVTPNREYELRSVPGDVLEMLQDPRRFINGRLSPLISRTTLEGITGRDWRGRKRSFGEQLMDAVKTPIPISIRGFVDKDAPELSAGEQVGNATGFRAKRHSEITRARILGHEWQKKMGLENTDEVYPQSKYLTLRNALEDHDEARARKAYQELLKTGDREKVGKGFEESLMKPFSGSEKNEAKFVATLKGEDLREYRAGVASRDRARKDFERITGFHSKSATVTRPFSQTTVTKRAAMPAFTGFN